MPLITEYDINAAADAVRGAIQAYPDEFEGVKITAFPGLVRYLGGAIMLERRRALAVIEAGDKTGPRGIDDAIYRLRSDDPR